MSQKVEKKPGRPKGLPKTGGRQKGTPNRNNVLACAWHFADAWLRLSYQELIDCIRGISDPVQKADRLLQIAPYIMQRRREESDVTSPAINPETLTEQDLVEDSHFATARSPTQTPRPGR
jgi:hypothetical protein